jgi:hypothetical protein
MNPTTANTDIVRLASLLGRFEAESPGLCRTEGCEHLHGPVATVERNREPALAA